MTVRLNKIRVLNIYEGVSLIDQYLLLSFYIFGGIFHYREVFSRLNNYKKESYFSDSWAKRLRAFWYVIITKVVPKSTAQIIFPYA